MSGVITPDDLKRIADEVEMAKARAALDKKRKGDHQRNEFRDSFMSREIQPEVFERLFRLVKSAAERGEHEVMVLRFPSAWCTNGGRAVNNFEPEWPQTLTGFAKKAHEFYEKERAHLGYRVRAQIMDYPGGVPGDVGLYLSW